MARPWHTLSLEEALQAVESGEQGLSEGEAKKRLAAYGPNALPEEKPTSKTRLFLRQFASPLIYILLAAALVILYLGETVDAGIIFAVLLFNAIVGFLQEGRAEHTLRALKQFVETNATVLRAGKELVVPDKEVVPGDLLLIAEGERVPADARILLSRGIRADESALTGESEPVAKTADALSDERLATAEQRNMLFRGTHIVGGAGRAVVVATGVSTVIGGIAAQISGIESEIPLQAAIRSLSRLIIAVVASVSALLFVAGLVSGHGAREMFTVVVSLAVSVIPEGLPVVLTLVLATGVWRMSRRNALVKKLQAVEALGQARIIAVDKTGTITKNELTVRKAWVEGTLFDISGIGYEPKGEVTHEGAPADAEAREKLALLAKIAALSASARLRYVEEAREWRIAGDPTEGAMVVLGEKLGLRKAHLLAEAPLLAEIPFDYRLKYHATLHDSPQGAFLAAAGAPETLLALSSGIRREGRVHPLAARERDELEATVARLSEEGLRVLAVAVRLDAPRVLAVDTVHALTFIGFLGMQDALRPVVAGAMQRARDAGIKIVMITGDHKITARAIAREAGIYSEGDQVLTGDEVDRLYDAELSSSLSRVTVFARVTPEHKMRIINAYKHRGDIVAMTGDGVNDAPSLVAADLGVAMGKSGTEVAKEAADLVLLDDDFGSIISAVEEGRSIYITIKKVILYLFSTSLGEVFVISAALLLGYPLPLLAGQIIWLNFVTDGFLTVALAMEPKEKGLLDGRFKRPTKYLVDRLMAVRMLSMALPMTVGTLVLFSQYQGGDLTKAWTIALTTLAVFQWFNAWNCRSENKSLLATSPLSNPFLVGATAVVILLQLLAVYHPLLQKLLHTAPLALGEWLMIIGVAASILVVEELRKLLQRRSEKRHLPPGHVRTESGQDLQLRPRSA